MPPPDPSAELRRVEAARYALLRRLALAMRHHMVVHLQPMGMITELMERRLQSAQPDLAQVHDSMGKIHGMARAAVDSCIDVVSWLAPPPDARVALDDGVRESLDLLRSSFNFRGFPIADALGGVQAEVARAAVRHLLPGALLALTDRAPPPAQVRVATEAAGTGGIITITLEPQAGHPGFPGNHPYRLLDWADVEAMAQAEGATVSRTTDGARIELPAAG